MTRIIKSKFLILFFVLLFSFLSVNGVRGNEEDLKRFQITLTLGTSFSNFWGDHLKFVESLNTITGYTFDQKKRIGWPIRCDINYYVKPWFSFKTGLLYANKGMKLRENFKGSQYDFNLDITFISDYLEIPLIIELSTVAKKNSSDPRFFINGGITAGFLSRSKIWTEAGGEYGRAGIAYDQKKEDWNEVNHTDFGYIIGIGCYFKDGLCFGVDYEKGLRSVSSAGWDFKNQVFSVKLGYYFLW
jgi:hypothetical protein